MLKLSSHFFSEFHDSFARIDAAKAGRRQIDAIGNKVYVRDVKMIVVNYITSATIAVAAVISFGCYGKPFAGAILGVCSILTGFLFSIQVNVDAVRTDLFNRLSEYDREELRPVRLKDRYVYLRIVGKAISASIVLGLSVTIVALLTFVPLRSSAWLTAVEPIAAKVHAGITYFLLTLLLLTVFRMHSLIQHYNHASDTAYSAIPKPSSRLRR